MNIRRPSLRRIVLEAAEFRRIVRRGYDDAVCKAALSIPVVSENRMRDHRSRRASVVRVNHHLDTICREHFHCAAKRRLRKRVSIEPDEQRPVDLMFLAIQADRLGDRQDMRFVERIVLRGATGPRFRTLRVAPVRMDPGGRCNKRPPAWEHR
jgi:hypothetical protein